MDQAVGPVAAENLDSMTGGTERDPAEFDEFFAASGWRHGKTYPVGGGYYGRALQAS